MITAEPAMRADTLFTIANPFTWLCWIALALAPLAPRWADWVAGWLSARRGDALIWPC